MRAYSAVGCGRGRRGADREAVAGAGMRCVGRVACREEDFGAEQWAGRLLALPAPPETVEWAAPRAESAVALGLRLPLPCSSGVASPRGQVPGCWVLSLPFWAGVVSSLSSWVSEGTSSLTEVRLVYDELVSG